MKRLIFNTSLVTALFLLVFLFSGRICFSKNRTTGPPRDAGHWVHPAYHNSNHLLNSGSYRHGNFNHFSLLAQGMRNPPVQQWRRWQSLPKKDKELLRRRYRRWQNMPEYKRRKLVAIYRTLKRMPPSERRKLIPMIRRWRSLTPDERHYVIQELRRYGFRQNQESI